MECASFKNTKGKINTRLTILKRNEFIIIIIIIIINQCLYRIKNNLLHAIVPVESIIKTSYFIWIVLTISEQNQITLIHDL